MVALALWVAILACRPNTEHRAFMEAVRSMGRQARATPPAHRKPWWIAGLHDR